MKDLFSQQPQCCYIKFPSWPSETSPWHSPRRPRNDDFYIPTVPPYYPYKEEKPSDGVADWFKKLQASQNFTQTKDGLKFRLELAGFAKEHVSVSIEDGKHVKVSAKNDILSYNNTFLIPNPEKYNLFNQPTAKMENGLLEIFFAAKKEEVKSIKIL